MLAHRAFGDRDVGRAGVTLTIGSRSSSFRTVPRAGTWTLSASLFARSSSVARCFSSARGAITVTATARSHAAPRGVVVHSARVANATSAHPRAGSIIAIATAPTVLVARHA